MCSMTPINMFIGLAGYLINSKINYDIYKLIRILRLKNKKHCRSNIKIEKMHDPFN